MIPPGARPNRSKLTLAAVAIALPIIGVTNTAQAQDPPDKSLVRTNDTVRTHRGPTKGKPPSQMLVQIIGRDNERILYQKSDGEVFYLDSSTGDMIFVPVSDSTSLLPGAGQKSSGKGRLAEPGSRARDKGRGGSVTIIGVDSAGRVLHRMTNGEVFYLDPESGDMIFVK